MPACKPGRQPGELGWLLWAEKINIIPTNQPGNVASWNYATIGGSLPIQGGEMPVVRRRAACSAWLNPQCRVAAFGAGTAVGTALDALEPRLLAGIRPHPPAAAFAPPLL